LLKKRGREEKRDLGWVAPKEENKEGEDKVVIRANLP